MIINYGKRLSNFFLKMIIYDGRLAELKQNDMAELKQIDYLLRHGSFLFSFFFLRVFCLF